MAAVSSHDPNRHKELTNMDHQEMTRQARKELSDLVVVVRGLLVSHHRFRRKEQKGAAKVLLGAVRTAADYADGETARLRSDLRRLGDETLLSQCLQLGEVFECLAEGRISLTAARRTLEAVQEVQQEALDLDGPPQNNPGVGRKAVRHEMQKRERQAKLERRAERHSKETRK